MKYVRVWVIVSSFFFLIFQIATSTPVWFSVSVLTYGTFVQPSITETVVVPTKPAAATFTFSKSPFDGIVFTGDLLLARNVEQVMQRHGAAHPFIGVNFLAASERPAVVTNLEGSIPSVHQPTPPGSLVFSVHQKLLPTLKQVGFTHFSLANNHSFDFGEKGYKETQVALHEEDLNFFGHPQTFTTSAIEIIKTSNGNIAVIGLHTLVNQPNQKQIDHVLRVAEKQSDYQVVYVHWGQEYQPTSSLRQREIAKKLVTAGADLIVGHHPHVVQEVGLIAGVPVFYSLGNFVFDQYFSSAVQEGLLINWSFTNEKILSLVPVSSEFSPSQPQMMSEAQRNVFLLDLAARSDPALRTSIEAGFVPLDNFVASSTKIAIMVK